MEGVVPGRMRMRRILGPGIGLCWMLSSDAGKSLVATTAPEPISRPEVMGVIVAVPTIRSRWVFNAPPLNVTVSPTLLWGSSEVSGVTP